MVSLPLVPTMVVSWMVTAAVPLTEPLVARIVAEPTPDDGAVYRPVEELIEPTPPLSTDQVTVADMGLPDWSKADAEKSWVWPSGTTGDAGVTLMDVRILFVAVTCTLTLLVTLRPPGNWIRT